MSPKLLEPSRPRARNAQLLHQLRAHRLCAEGRVDPRRIGDAGKPLALWHILAAVIGGQHHRIIDAAAVEHLQEIADLAVELGQLEAHLLPSVPNVWPT